MPATRVHLPFAAEDSASASNGPDARSEFAPLRAFVLEAVVSGQSLRVISELLCWHVVRLAPELACRPQRSDGEERTPSFTVNGSRSPTLFENRLIEAARDLFAIAVEHQALWGHLRDNNARFEVALSNMSQGLCFFNGEQRLILANRRYSELYNIPQGLIQPGMHLHEIVALRYAAGSGPKMEVTDYLDWRDSLRVNDRPKDTVVELVNGRTIAVHHQPMPDSGWVATHEDITERRRAEAKVFHMARHDALTGLPNRISFREHLEHAIALTGRGQACALLCLDLDRFKWVNDSFGHPTGDLLLQQAATRIQACIREIDTATRLGGDEFAVLLCNLERPEKAADTANRLIETLKEPFDLDGHQVCIGVSIGIAVAPLDGSSVNKLLKSADTALYRAKHEQRGTFRFFKAEMDALLQAQLVLDHELRAAVRNQEFELVYQPMYEIAKDRYSGYEALLRWRHPTRGVIGPAEFIPVAEETGLIREIGKWVLTRACADAATWPDYFKVSVNLSARQFTRNDLAATVWDALTEAGLPARRLELEITETTLLANRPDIVATLHELRELGISISMDDFGTGYSSLSYLRSFPFDRLKIDQSFIHELSDQPNSIAIIRAVLTLSKSLGIATTAEGVESLQQLECLRTEGCDEIQGYYLSEPVPPEEALRLAWSFRGGALHAEPAE